MIILGIDPDLHNTGIATLLGSQVREVAVARVSRRLKGRDAVLAMVDSIASTVGLLTDAVELVVVEGQVIYLGKTKNPMSILHLAQVAGGALRSGFARSKLLPEPREWKGSVPKQIHQARVLTELGWAFERRGTVKDGYCVPTSAPNVFGAGALRPSDWKHVTDAIGLALWGYEKGRQQ